MIAASRAQIGEFSFILGGARGQRSGYCRRVGRDLVLAGALISILLTPFLFAAADWIYAHQEPRRRKRRRNRRRARACSPKPRRASRSRSTQPDRSRRAGRLWPRRQRGRRGAEEPRTCRCSSSRATRTSSRPCASRASRRSSATQPIRSLRRPRTIRRRAACWSRSPTASRADRWSSRRARSIRSFRSSRARIPRRRSSTCKRHGATKVIMGEHLIAHAMIEDARERRAHQPDASVRAISAALTPRRAQRPLTPPLRDLHSRILNGS